MGKFHWRLNSCFSKHLSLLCQWLPSHFKFLLFLLVGRNCDVNNCYLFHWYWIKYIILLLQAIARQCLEALEFLHHLRIIHCDLKPENILIKSYSRCEIKVIDLGSSCFETDNLFLYVQSRSYRAPEVILGLPYDQKIDIWSLGCILAELHTGDVSSHLILFKLNL